MICMNTSQYGFDFYPSITIEDALKLPITYRLYGRTDRFLNAFFDIEFLITPPIHDNWLARYPNKYSFQGCESIITKTT